MTRDFRLPDLGEGISEGEVLKVLVAEGDVVAEDQPLFEIETDKAAIEVPSPYAGRVARIHVHEGDMVAVGAVLVTIAEGDGEPAQATEERVAKPRASVERERGESTAPVPATPATRRRARELGIDLHAVRGTGTDGRVTDADVEAFARHAVEQPRASVESEPEHPSQRPLAVAPGFMPGAAQLPPLPDFTQWGTVERVPLRSVRRRIAEHMTLAHVLIPHVSHFDRADITALEAFRQKHHAEGRVHDAQLTLTTFVLKAAVAALKHHPRFNASVDQENGEFVLKHYYHLGVAVDTERGLIVPVLRDVDRKSVWELAVELGQLAERTRAGKVEREALRGGTFTITNIGSLGGTGMVPIINYPEVAILGLARARQEPVVVDGAIVPRLILPLSLTFDHRIADGADAARFTTDLVRDLEDPDRLLLDA
jgi:pyruvate dehydrogenase E2 component (dihydrolipoamide acetyltransferase)